MPEYQLKGRDGRTVTVTATAPQSEPRQDGPPSRSTPDWTRLVVRGSKAVVAVVLVGGLVWGGTAAYNAVMGVKRDVEQTLADPLGVAGAIGSLDGATGSRGTAADDHIAEERLAEAQRQREAAAREHHDTHGSVMVCGLGEVPEGATVRVVVRMAEDATATVKVEPEPVDSCGYDEDPWQAQAVTLAAGQTYEYDLDVSCGGIYLALSWEGSTRAAAARWLTVDVAPGWERPDQSHLEALGLPPDDSPLLDVTRDGVEGADE